MFQPDKLADLISEDRCAGPKPYTLESLAAWLETMPADGNYVWENCAGGCLISIYAFAHGVGTSEHYYNAEADKFLQAIGRSDAEYIAVAAPFTFGAALERTRAAIKAART